MNHKKIDGVQVWNDLQDLAERLKLKVIERALYSCLLLHTRLEGKPRRRFTMTELARKAGISHKSVIQTIRRLAEHRILRLVDCSYSGHLMEVRLPADVRGASRKAEAKGRSKWSCKLGLEKRDFLTSRASRRAIHAREGSRCFYCLRRVPVRGRCLDHVVPRAKSGKNSYRNLVSCCVPCNWQKSDHRADDFLRKLYREGRLSEQDLRGRLRALHDLKEGKLRPTILAAGGISGSPRKGG